MRMIDTEHNLGFSPIADMITDICINRSITYADDVWFSSEDRDVLADILKSFVIYTACLGLSLNESKSYLLATKHTLEEIDKSPLNIPGTDFTLHFVDSVTYLGYGLKADKMLNIEDHLLIRNDKKDELQARKTAKKLRYIYKGDLGIIKNYFQCK